MTREAAYKRYVLCLLTVIALFNYVDRMALGVVLQDIKADLHLSDTQLGFLSGIAFALFYSVMGIPMGRWADRGNRATIITLTALLWSVAVALCGMVASFTQLLLVRIAVAVGEAGCIPPAFSLIADYFNRAERPRANAIYGMGGALSFLVGFLVAGQLDQHYGWRMTFIVLASPGLVLAALAWFTLKEPRRKNLHASPATHPSFTEVARTLLANATFRHLVLSLSVLYLFGYGMLQWMPAFLIRSYGLGSAQAGAWMAVTYGVSGLLGTYLGGEWATRLAAGNERLQLRVVSWLYASSSVCQFFVFLSPYKSLTFVMLGLSVVGPYATNASMFATIQALVPERMRAVSIAFVYLVANLIGMGFGPLLAGALSDGFRSWAGEESLRYALWSLAPGYLWGAWHAWRASQSVTRDFERSAMNTSNGVLA